MSNHETILVVDDDLEILDLMRDYIGAAGFHVRLASSAGEAMAVLEAEIVDCILLDVMMPVQSGFEFCRRVRERWDLPILFLSAQQDDAAKLRGLGLGADDYIGKSSSPAEVVARIQAVLRRYHRGGGNTRQPVLLSFGPLALNLTAHEVTVEGNVIPFTAKEFELLRLLAEYPRQVFTREQIVERIWDGFSDPLAVNGLITRIRAKIEQDPQHPRFITTVWGVGYRFEGERSR